MKFKTIPGFPNYEISEIGIVRNKKTGREVSIITDLNTGGVYVNLQNRNKRTKRQLGALLKKTFKFSLKDCVVSKTPNRIKGAYFSGGRQWRAVLPMGNNKSKYVGSFSTKIEAAMAYYAAYKSRYGREPFSFDLIAKEMNK